MNRIGIFGIGAIGSMLSKYLIRNTTNQYFFFNRTNKNSTRIEFEQEVNEIPIKLSCKTERELDWLIICIKENHINSAIQDIKKIIGLEC